MSVDTFLFILLSICTFSFGYVATLLTSAAISYLINSKSPLFKNNERVLNFIVLGDSLRWGNIWIKFYVIIWILYVVGRFLYK